MDMECASKSCSEAKICQEQELHVI
jgi:hypothetical protein